MTPTLPSSAREMYEAVVARVVAAVPEIQKKDHDWDENDIYPSCCHCYLYGKDLDRACIRPITLEDVLRACGEGNCWLSVSERGLLHSLQATKENYFWHFGHDLAWHRDNAPQTLEFLYNLLCTP